jgi:hypothetical protein
MKTAIQWLKEQYIERGETLPLGVFEEAKKMERQQILLAHTTGYNDCYKYHKGLTKLITPQGADEYYNKNYKTNNNEPN